MRRALLLPLAPIAAFCLIASAPSPAAAGPLAEVSRGIDNKVDTHSDSGSSSSSSSHDSEPDYTVDYDGSDCCTSSVYVVSEDPDDSAEPRPLVLEGPARLDLYLGAQSVVGSQGALIGEVRASKGWLGIAASTSSYFEEIQGKPGADSIRMDLMAFTVGIRPLRLGATELWLDGGLAFLGSSEFESMLGTAFAVRGEHQVSRDLSLVGQFRFFAMEHDVAAAELWGGVRAWYLAVGYRSLKFNVGPPLHGPEAALSLRF